MSKLGCICGHTIVNQTDNLAYKAEFIRNQDLDAIDNRTDEIAKFIEAIKNDTRDKWLDDFYGLDIDKSIANSSVVFDIIGRYTMNYESTIYQCEKCGRIKIQKGTSNKYLSFLPEDEEWRDIFKGLSTTKEN